MASIWCHVWCDGYDSGVVCIGHYSSKKGARAALVQLRANVVAQKRRDCEEVLAEVKAGRFPRWSAQAGRNFGQEYVVDEIWVEREVEKVAERFDMEHAIKEEMLDSPTPILTE